MSWWRQLRAIVLLPGNVTVVVPALILVLGDGPDVGWGLGGAPAVLVSLLGVVLIGAGFAVWLWTVRLFRRIGRGTLAPWDPTTRLVVEGPYRHMRNPMIAAVGTLLAGEAIFFGSPWILAWAAFFIAVNSAFFLLGEEPGLERRFGDEYRAYRRAVPRWIPRRTPWSPVGPPLGAPLDWTPVEPPRRTPLRGSHVLLRPVDAAADTESLYAASHPPDGDPAIWTYLPDGPYESPDRLWRMLAWAEASEDPLFFTVLRLPDERPLGLASYLRIAPEFGVIEIGHIWFAASLQRTTAATEAIYLLVRHVFDELGYRRLEWKCDALNAASRRAAERFGFNLEGIFRKHQVVKARNRDTAWYAITDDAWPAVRAGFESWLAPGNFDAAGVQRRSLGELIALARK